MTRTCKKCRKGYDDAEMSTLCPHALIMPRADLDRKIAALELLKARMVRFNHEPEGPDRRVQSVNWCGMITVQGMAGEFDPSLFKVSPETKIARQVET